MKKFNYVIKDALGIHARPAGLIVKEAKEFESKITISCNGKEADATRLMAIMALCVKQGLEVTVTIEGPDEEDAFMSMQVFFENNL